MDELDVGGKKYISSKRASELTGYAKDYIGQLLRAGKVSGTRFGRAWYVEESEILRHAGKVVPQDLPAAPVADPEAIVPNTPSSTQKPAVRATLTHHMITPSVLPKTWSSIQYLEDDSDLFPAITPHMTEVVHENKPEKKPEKEEASEIKVPVSVIRTKTAVEKRVATLVDGIKPRSPMLRVAQSAPVPAVKKVKEERPAAPLRKSVPVHWSAGSFATAVAVFVFVFGSFASFFFIKTISAGNSEALTASTFYGLTDFLSLLKDAHILEGGIEALRTFWNLLSESFGVFLRAGADFILSLF